MTADEWVRSVLIVVGVAVELVSCLGLVVIRQAIDRLHYAGAGTVVGPVCVAAAVAVREGFVSQQSLNALVIALVLAIAGSVVTTATARAIRLRDRGSLEATPGERNRAPER
jgi:multisubunit Na+/H+ antiporter MnhG subunit